MPRPLLNKGLGFPIHPFLRGLLEFYGLQLHHLTPALVLHIAGFVALCELFLGVEAHFGLWKELFCLVPRSKKGSMYQVGGAEVWRIAGTGYLSETPKKASEDWPSEWFYMEDAPLPDPVRIGLPEFNNAPLKKRLRLISDCGRSYFASCPVPRKGQCIKWAEPKYGASPGPDIYPKPRRRRPKTGLQNGSTWRTPLCRIQFGSASLNSTMLP